ncbi:MAG: GPP34 family phosphoprotein [Acidobacteriota bacterium]
MFDRDHLPLHEEVLLLALRDDEGTIAPGTMYQHALAGAMLSELMLQQRIAVDESDRKKRAEVIDRTPTGLPLLDECLARMADDKPRSLQHWVQKLSAMRNLKHRVAERLCDRGILHEEEGTILLVFSRRVYPETDPRPEKEIVERLRRAIFTDERDVDPRTVVLLSLADAAGILKVAFDKKELKERKQRIAQVVNGEVMGKAAREAIQAVQAAVMVAAIMPAIISTTVTH